MSQPHKDAADQIVTNLERAIKEIERAAYKRGWDDALAHLVKMVNDPKSPVQPQQQEPFLLPEVASNGSAAPEATMIEMVYDTISREPGQRGTSIVNAIHLRLGNRERKSVDRTARTALMRLRKRGRIERRDGRWYPKEAV